jgi:23S rRNA (cytosine1962-C5)-methyltransferase
MPVPALKLKANVPARVLGGHPWVFGNEVEALLPPEFDGEAVECRDRANRHLGTGIYNSKSQIVWRRLGRERVALDAAYFRGALQRALARRRGVAVAGEAKSLSARRLVWSESDELPGVVVDQFGDVLVVQIQTIAMEKRSALIGDLLAELLEPAEIIFRNDAPIRRLEGLPLEVHTRSGRPWAPRWVEIDSFDYWLDLQGGQKTGFYLDQRSQHAAVARYCSGQRVLDAFCNQGPFALHAARAGAAQVLGLDSAEDAIAAARRNAERNRVTAEFAVANVFDWFNAPERKEEPLWDVIILDPPPFAKSKSALEGALRGGWRPEASSRPIPAPITCMTRSCAGSWPRPPPMPGAG